MKTLILAALLCVLLAQTSAQGQSCPSGWDLNNGRCFTFVPKYMSWYDAKIYCQSLGGNLASVRDGKEYGLIRYSKGQAPWLGGTDAQKEGTWTWTDGTPFKYTNWAPGQPDNWQGNENCLHITAEGKQWNDANCNELLPSLCAKNL